MMNDTTELMDEMTHNALVLKCIDSKKYQIFAN